MGTAMSITAFPVLARILKERNLLGTDLGTTAISCVSCAAIDDVSAWLLLAVLTAMVHSAQSWHRLAVTLLLLMAFVAICSRSAAKYLRLNPCIKSTAQA
jgi:Kef-type K+ transport system membrane component KefB